MSLLRPGRLLRRSGRRARSAALITSLTVSLSFVPDALPRLRAGAAVDVLLLLHGGRWHARRSKLIHHRSVAFFFLFHPRPAHHASASLRRSPPASCAPSACSTGCRSRPPRGVTVFAERSGETGAARPQKRRRHFPPPIACGFMRRTRTFPPPMRRHAACSGCV
jgi:hypothetical protein